MKNVTLAMMNNVTSIKATRFATYLTTCCLTSSEAPSMPANRRRDAPEKEVVPDPCLA
jgi:hypothetical protein